MCRCFKTESVYCKLVTPELFGNKIIQSIDLWLVSPESPAIIVSILGDYFLPLLVYLLNHQQVLTSQNDPYHKLLLILILNL